MQRNPVAYGVVVGCIVVLTAMLLVIPSYFLATGLQAAGAAAGWWVGDPTTNDGEETWATAIGLIGCTMVVAVGLGAALGLRRRFGVTSRVPALLALAVPVVLGTVAWVGLMAGPAFD